MRHATVIAAVVDRVILSGTVSLILFDGEQFPVGRAVRRHHEGDWLGAQSISPSPLPTAYTHLPPSSRSSDRLDHSSTIRLPNEAGGRTQFSFTFDSMDRRVAADDVRPTAEPWISLIGTDRYRRHRSVTGDLAAVAEVTSNDGLEGLSFYSTASQVSADYGPIARTRTSSFPHPTGRAARRYRTTVTGTGARRTIFSATLPSSTRETPDRPWLPTTM